MVTKNKSTIIFPEDDTVCDDVTSRAFDGYEDGNCNCNCKAVPDCYEISTASDDGQAVNNLYNEDDK